MSEFEVYFKVPDSKWNEGVLLNKYQDTYSLIAAQESATSQGTIYKRWCFPQGKDRKPSEKTIPIKITLGDRQAAISMIRGILAELEGGGQEGAPF